MSCLNTGRNIGAASKPPTRMMSLKYKSSDSLSMSCPGESTKSNFSSFHMQKRNKKVENMCRFKTPYLLRKQETKGKNIWESQTPKKSTGIFANFFQVTQVKAKEKEISNPEKIASIKEKKEIKLRLCLEKPSFDIKSNKNELSSNSKPNFNNFPSHLNDFPVRKSSASILKRDSTSISHFFFPTNRIRCVTSYESVKENKNNFGLSSPETKKQKKNERIFNFDGTFENHKINIPERPKTSQSEKKYFRNNELLNYEIIAKKCIKKRKHKKEDILNHILPWEEENLERAESEFLNVSISTIQD